eukprot:TRINITY_DN32086_c0_g1_i1.p1 TRINITY_DN32086_c0_g1~~TRINITY_DN32086_c0_g1_i1.p1  ORF type:complete len:1071 (-),score=184.00 TRINITY_DN32086_c0_g1_i1:122-3334(-)
MADDEHARNDGVELGLGRDRNFSRHRSREGDSSPLSRSRTFTGQSVISRCTSSRVVSRPRVTSDLQEVASRPRVTSDLQDVGTSYDGLRRGFSEDCFEGVREEEVKFPWSHFESIDLHPVMNNSESEEFSHTSKLARFVLDAVIGAIMAGIGWCVTNGIKYFSHLRTSLSLKAIGEGPLTGDSLSQLWGCNTLISLGYVTIAASVCIWRPGAIGSGIPGVITFLNGVDLRDQIFSRGVLLAKVVGVIFACSSGLAVGPEGPMIHIGATVGILVYRHLIRLDWLRRQLGVERSARLVELHVAAVGAGCGVTAAFGAPIAGTLFVVEEAASWFSPDFFIAVFSAGIVSVALLAVGKSGLPYESVFAVAKGLDCGIVYKSTMAACIVLGVVCGVAGWLFNRLCVQFGNFRKFLRQKKRCGPVFFLFEVLLLSVLSTTVESLLPSVASCRASTLQNLFKRSSTCVKDEWASQIYAGTVFELQAEDEFGKVMYVYQGHQYDVQPEGNQAHHKDGQLGEGRLIPRPGLYGVQYNPRLCPWAISKNIDCNLEKHGLTEFLDKLNVEPAERYNYCCGFDNATSFTAGKIYSFSKPQAPLTLEKEYFPAFGCEREYDAENHVELPYYRPLAALAFVPGHEAVQNLFSRGAPNLLPVHDIMCWWPVYFVLAAVTSGSAVPCGLVVPMLYLGASLGRVTGLVMLYLQESAPSVFGYEECSTSWYSPFAPLLLWLKSAGAEAAYSSCYKVDPGTTAVVGAAAFMSASGSIVLFVIVMLVEVTSDTSFIIPVAIGAIVGRFINNLLCGHGLYHTLMDLSKMPFLGRWHGQRNHEPCLAALPKDRHSSARPEREELESSKLRVQSTLNDLMEKLRPIATGSAAPSEAQVLHTELRESELRLRLALDRACALKADHVADSEIRDIAQARRALRKLPEEADPDVVRSILKTTRHHAFPVVNSFDHLVGLVRREDLEMLLKRCQDEGHLSSASDMTSSSDDDEDAMHDGRTSAALNDDGNLVLSEIMDMHPQVVHYKVPILRVHRTFQQMMLRHVVVTDFDRRPLGVITRQSLLDISEDGLAEAFGP